MEATSTSIRPRDNRPPIANNEDDSWTPPPNITGSTIKDPELVNTSRSILTISDSDYRAILKYTTRILQSKILKGKPFLTDEEIYMEVKAACQEGEKGFLVSIQEKSTFIYQNLSQLGSITNYCKGSGYCRPTLWPRFMFN